MSEKTSKGYDPTIARMVGNMLAGNLYSSYPIDTRTELCIAVANKTVKALRKQFKEEEKD